MASIGPVFFPQGPLGYYQSGRDLQVLLENGGGSSCRALLVDDLDIDDFLETQLIDQLNGPSGSPPLGFPSALVEMKETDQEAPLMGGLEGEIRPKPRRGRSKKNKEEMENQRKAHIAIERNRRKQMNEYLSALRSLLPESYVQRGDQASIIGGAITFLKELEQQLHHLSARKRSHSHSPPSAPPQLPFSDCFTAPQYSLIGEAPVAKQQTNEVADIEVTKVDSHANVKIQSDRRRQRQLLRLITGLHALRLTVLHLSFYSFGLASLYSLSLKVEDDCKLTSGEEIASAVYQILLKFEGEVTVN
ncbi:hypothetical protein SAY87_022001 [Trapa incisa]|uniref:BHLH domain-containing protein n=1 Tax=Trapa incisa TaxID=236973 RepID=A0AAN7JXW9_9MYRT|nr:hypothetical protein SAY87_022001 [Trapa incisa]